MAVPACFHIADDVFPRVRAHAARRLRADGWSQGRIAQVLGVSQAMVSKYTHRDDDETDPLVLRLSDDVVAGADAPAAPGPGPWCTTLHAWTTRVGADDAVQDLLDAERILLDRLPSAWVPQVGMNIARALPDAAGPEDVLAYPARIVAAGDRLVRPVPPAFGASSHLAGILLRLRRTRPDLHAIANLSGTPDVVDAVTPNGPVATVQRNGETDPDHAIHRLADQGHAFIHDAGAFGVEPALYLAAADARSLATLLVPTPSARKP